MIVRLEVGVKNFRSKSSWTCKACGDTNVLIHDGSSRQVADAIEKFIRENQDHYYRTCDVKYP